MDKDLNKNSKRKAILIEVATVCWAAFFNALGLSAIMIPNGLTYGGIAGLARLVQNVGHVPMKERGMVTSAASGDQRSFIDYVMVDPAYDGSFSAEILFTDNFDDMRFITNGSVAFVAVDVFGREYFYRMDKIDG